MEESILSHFQSKPQSVKERIAQGKALRKQFPLSEQGDYQAAPDRADPISTLIAQGEKRISELIPIRHARMLSSPFAFLRGSAAIMAADLAASTKSTGIIVQACGDMHVANFGVFASAERNLVFGINDFDETLPGPWEWDLKRLVASIVASSKFLGANDEECKGIVLSAVKSYRKHMHEYAKMGYLELWYATISEADILKTMTGSARKKAQKIMGKAHERTHMQVLGKLADLVDSKYRLRENAPFIVRETKTEDGMPIEEALALGLESYLNSMADERITLLKNYRITDVVRKVVGVGSVGTRCWVVFLTGNHQDDPLFLQIKEAQPSVLEPYLSKSIYSNQGQRVVIGQRLLQAAPDILLGWFNLGEAQFYIRQLRDKKGGLEFDPKKAKIKNLDQYSSLCGWALALAHAKSGDAAMISGYVGNSDELDQAMVRFAFAYDAQTEKDYQAMIEAAKIGRIEVAHDEA